MQTIKDTAANMAATAKSSLEKTKDTMTEKGEKLISNDNPTRTGEAAGGSYSYSYSTTGEKGNPTGSHQMSALPGHGTGEPMGQVTEGTMKSHPIGKTTGDTRPITAHNTQVGSGTNMGYGTGGAYSG